MSLKNSEFPSSAIFDTMNEAFKADDAVRKDALKTGTVFGFKLKNAAGKEASWYIDAKQTGTVGAGIGPNNKKADVTLVLPEAEFSKLVEGKAKAQNLFMSGKLKIQGNMMKAMKLEPILNKLQPPKAKL